MGLGEFLNVVEIINDRGKLLTILKTLQTLLVYYIIFGALEWADIRLSIMLNPSLSVSDLNIQVMLTTGLVLLILYLMLRWAINNIAEMRLRPLKKGGYKEIIDEVLNMIQESIESGETNYEGKVIRKWVEMLHSVSFFGWVNGFRKEFEKYLIPVLGAYGVLYYFSTAGIVPASFGTYILSPLTGLWTATGTYILVTMTISTLKIDLRKSLNLAKNQYGQKVKNKLLLYAIYVIITLSYFIIPYSFFNFIAEDIGGTKPSEKEGILDYRPRGKNEAPGGEFVAFVKQLIEKYDVRPLESVGRKIENPEEIFQNIEYMRAKLPTPTTVAINKNTYLIIYRPVEERDGDDKPAMSVVTFVLERTPIETTPGRKTRYSYVVHIKEVFIGSSLTEPILNKISLEREGIRDNTGKKSTKENQNFTREQLTENLRKMGEIQSDYPAIVISMVPGENKWHKCEVSVPTLMEDNTSSLSETEKEQIRTVVTRVTRGFTPPRSNFFVFAKLQIVERYAIRENPRHRGAPTSEIRVKELSIISVGDNRVRTFIEKLVKKVVEALNRNNSAQETLSKISKNTYLYLLIKNVKE